jgi:hypothetical protein
MKKTLSTGDVVVISLTVIFFVAALFLKGFTKDLLLEIGVLLVSIKLIMFNYKQTMFDTDVVQRLDALQKDVTELKGRTR